MMIYKCIIGQSCSLHAASNSQSRNRSGEFYIYKIFRSHFCVDKMIFEPWDRREMYISTFTIDSDFFTLEEFHNGDMFGMHRCSYCFYLWALCSDVHSSSRQSTICKCQLLL